MKIAILICTSTFELILSSFADTETNERKVWFSERRAMIDRAKTSFDDQAVNDLARIVYGIGHNLPSASEEGKTLYFQARSLLLGSSETPNHFVKQMKIERAKCVVENERRSKYGSKPSWGSYDDFRGFAFNTLQLLPSPDTVRVIGEYLYDTEETQEPITIDYVPDSFGPASNSSLAAEALKKLIEKPPVGADRNVQKPSDIPAWQLWYEQVKAGSRTFRFKGDPTEYDLNGPAPQDKLARIERDRKRDAERSAGHKKSSSVSDSETTLTQITKPSSVAGILSACALMAGAVWYFLKGRKGV